MNLSIIIPTLNEAAALPRTLASVRAQARRVEVIVADGGSGDGTRELAERSGANVVAAPRGRARQMNAGAAAATGDVLLFLHADTLLPPGGLDRIVAAMRPSEVTGGCFRLRFDAEGPLYAFYSRCTHLRWPRMVFGDRAIFARAESFARIGGYPEISIFEDVECVRALCRQGRFAFLPEYVTTSARRFEQNGAVRQQLLNVSLFTLYLLGLPPRRLHTFYSYQAV